MDHSKLPFSKFLLYVLVLTKNDRTEFDKFVSVYLPSLQFNQENMYDETLNYLKKLVVPKTIINGKYYVNEFNKFLKDQNLFELHQSFTTDEFLDLIFDTDLRRKIDGMRLSPVFREVDVYKEFNLSNRIILKSYIECFANFSGLDSKVSYVNKYVADKDEQHLFDLILKNTSKQYLKVVIGIKANDLSPKEEISHALQVVKLKLNTALLNNDSSEIEKWTKLSVAISEKLLKIGAGVKSDVDELLDVLRAEPDYENPKIYSKEELEQEYQAKTTKRD